MANFSIRIAQWIDKEVLHDIDLKCFDYPWDESYWLYWFQETRVVFLVEDNGVPVGLLAGALNEDGLVIEKIGVKPDYENMGASRLLIDACEDLTIQCPEKPKIHIVIPEPWLYPDSSHCLANWLRGIGFKARLPYLPDYFHHGGEDIDGVRCEREVD